MLQPRDQTTSHGLAVSTKNDATDRSPSDKPKRTSGESHDNNNNLHGPYFMSGSNPIKTNSDTSPFHHNKTKRTLINQTDHK